MKKETRSVRFLYQTKAGRCCLKILVHPWISKAAGAFLSCGLSRPLVGAYVKKNRIDLSGYPQRKYTCFNDFFTRQRNTDDADTCPDHLISPCDAYLSVYPIREDSVFTIKHVQYRLDQLLDDPQLAKHYAGGDCLIFRLTPLHYHRYCYACGGTVQKKRRIEGKLHCVRPIAYTSIPVFVQNSREYMVIDSAKFGQVVQMEVGALLVGKIKNHPVEQNIHQADEKGFFEFGGSTIILLLEKDRVKLDPAFSVQPEEEKDVRYGMKIGAIS